MNRKDTAANGLTADQFRAAMLVIALEDYGFHHGHRRFRGHLDLKAENQHGPAWSVDNELMCEGSGGVLSVCCCRYHQAAELLANAGSDIGPLAGHWRRFRAGGSLCDAQITDRRMGTVGCEHQFAQQCDSCKAAGRGCAFSVAEVAYLDSLRAAPPELWTHDKVDRRKATPKSSFVWSSKVAVIQV